MEITLEEWAMEWFRIHAEGRLAPNTEGGYRNLIFNHIGAVDKGGNPGEEKRENVKSRQKKSAMGG